LLSTAAAAASPSGAGASTQAVSSARLQMGEDGGQLKVSVQLPGLGKVEVRAVNSSAGTTTAHLTTSSQDALPVLESGRAGLEQALRSRDVVLGSMETQGQRSFQQNSSSQQSFQQHSFSQHSFNQGSQNSQGQGGQQGRQDNPYFQTSVTSGVSATAEAVATEAGGRSTLTGYTRISVRA
jgi:flagellar hook-length control protein FliK